MPIFSYLDDTEGSVQLMWKRLTGAGGGGGEL
jgi:hypothetical protein